ncbi:MAG: hypothetical protein ABIU05_18795 [Nitrospirales bacterium]
MAALDAMPDQEVERLPPRWLRGTMPSHSGRREACVTADKNPKTKAPLPSRSIWNVPDWQDAAAYPNPQDLTLTGWRWQFLRRRKDYREDFATHAGPTFEYECIQARAASKQKRSKLRIVPPEHPAFRARLLYLAVEDDLASQNTFHEALTQFRRYDLVACGLPNPLCIRPPGLHFERLYGGFLEGPFQHPVQLSLRDDQILFTFCLSKPLIPQEQWISDLLRKMQAHRYGKKVARRARREDWPAYLRVLDARAAGVPLHVIGTTVLKFSGTDKQIAIRVHQDIYQPAYDLGINFPN